MYNDDTSHNEKATQDIQNDNPDGVTQNGQSMQQVLHPLYVYLLMTP